MSGTNSIQGSGLWVHVFDIGLYSSAYPRVGWELESSANCQVRMHFGAGVREV